MAQGESQAMEDDEIGIDLDDLTFREQLEVRTLIRELVGDEADDPPMAAVIPAALTVTRRREDPEFTLEQALDLKWEDARKRPTKARKTRASSGARSSQSTGAD